MKSQMMAVRHRLDAIQVLRAIAAIGVVMIHAIIKAAQVFPDQARYSFLANFHDLREIGGAGVDVFFVISGFIMMYAHCYQFGDRKSPSHFMARRIIRIVPLYWALTGLAFLLLAFAPKVFNTHSELDAPWVIGSFFFIMIAPHKGIVYPVVGQGWTLNYEMFFYAVFAVALWLPRRRAIQFISIAFAVLLAVGLLYHTRPPWFSVWTDPLLVEFLAGIFLAIAYRRGQRLFSRRIGLIALTLGLFLFAGTVWDAPVTRWSRLGLWGIPAILVVWGVLSLEVHDSPWLSFGVFLGDASYSIYLFQAFALSGLSIGLKVAMRGRSMPVDLAAIVLLLAAVVTSIGCYWVLERPMTRYLKEFLRRTERGRDPQS